MKAILSFPACNRRGGVERVMAESANFLAAKGHDVTVVSAAIDSGVLEARVSQVCLPVRSRSPIIGAIEFRRRANRSLAAMQDDSRRSVHASFGVVCPPDGVLWVQSVHAEWIKLSRSRRNWKGRLKQRLNPFHPFILRLESQYYRGRQYRKLIALTTRVRDELTEHYGVPTQDVCVLSNGYNPNEFSVGRRDSGERDRVRSELGYRPSDRVVIFVANELERKGFFPLLQAMKTLRECDVRLLVAGRASIAPHADLIRHLGLEGQVKAVGPSADVGRYYAAADVFALPTYYEAWGLVIVEALASGLPVLTSQLAGASVAVREGVNGLLLDDPRDPLEISTKLDRLLRSAWPSPGEISSSVHGYRWEHILVQYEQILQEHCK